MIAKLLPGTQPLCWLVLCTIAATASAQEPEQQPQQHPLIPAIEHVRKSLDVLKQVKDYEATLVKREIVNGQDSSQTMQLRLRHEPFSLYLKFEQPNAGREILFVHGQNQNQVLAHEGSGLASLVGTVSLPLNDPRITGENRHALTDIGMKRLLELLIAQWELESKYGEIDVQFYPDAKLGNASCEVIQVTHPRPRNQFPYARTMLFLEKNSRLPLRLQNYAFPRQPGQPEPLAEDYMYYGIKLNVGLTDGDFDRRNPRYSF
ncbi:DUF1571 domain-containing protein [Planctomicrobium sp. SH664]|uniref:DUF1571 domain-containing protein n=1 Tax=Planctomicrobium sp. SH664 TaxID=3448125 RepID=UPI003F5CBC06